MIIRLQKSLEYDQVAKILVMSHPKKYNKDGGIIHAIVKADGLKQEYKDKLLIEIIKESIR